MRRACLSALLGMATATGAMAGNLKYQPINPNFGGAPLNGSFLLGSASAQNQYQEDARSGIADRTPAQEFAATLQRRLLSATADQISEAIFGKDAKNSGEFVVGNTTIRFNRNGNTVDLVINDGANETRVSVPVAF